MCRYAHSLSRERRRASSGRERGLRTASVRCVEAPDNRTDLTDASHPERGGLYWTTFVFLALSLGMFAVWLASAVLSWATPNSGLFDVSLRLLSLGWSYPFMFAYLVVPAAALALFVVWSRTHTAHATASRSPSPVGLRIGLGVLAFWGWFSTLDFAFRARRVTYPTFLTFLISLGLPLWRELRVAALAACVALSVIALARMRRMTDAPAPFEPAVLAVANPTSDENKVCPMCAETVKAAALVCRYCGYDFVTSSRKGQSMGTNGLAVASLVLGIVWLGAVGSLLAVIFGYRAIGQIRSSGGAQGGRGLAIAGVVLGWIGLVFFALFLLVVISR